MLPHEAEITAAITLRYRGHLEAMTGLHNAVVGMMSAGSWTIRKRGMDRQIVMTMMGLVTKACKTFRCIQVLCERGLHDDANALVRVLMETSVAIVFILQRKSKERTLVYHAYGLSQQIKTLEEWRRTKGLKRRVPVATLERAKAELARYEEHLPAGTDVKRHWSGKPSLREAVRALRGDTMYQSLYRHTSSIAHASDFGLHFEIDPVSGEPVWEIEPKVEGFEAPSYAARELLWNAAHRVDQRLGLGFSSTLAPYKLSSADVRKGQK